MLLEECIPKYMDDFLGNKERLSAIKIWLKEWKKGSALMITGPCWCGKSLAIELAAKDLGYELVKSYASDERKYGMFEKSVINSSRQRSLVSRGKIILIEDMESMESVKGVAELIKSSEYPVVLITDDPYEKSLVSLRKNCKIISFSKIRHDSIAGFLKAACRKHGIACDEGAVEQLARSCNGDLRAALIDMEMLDSGIQSQRESEEDIFNTLKIIFKTFSIDNAQTAIINSEKAVDELMLWLEENVAEEYSNPEEIAMAFDYLSKADIINTRIIKRQSWVLMKYLNTAVYGIALSKKGMNKKFVSYRPPKFFARRGIPSDEIAKAMHCSKKKAREYSKLLDLLSD